MEGKLIDMQIGNLSSDERAVVFEQLYMKYHGRLVLYVNKYVHDTELAKDIVQEVFTAFWKQIEHRTFKGNAKAYLFQAVRNKALNTIRDNKKLQTIDETPAAVMNAAERSVVCNPDNPFTSLLELELEEQFGQVMNRLPKGCVEVFQMSRNEGLKNKEIAERMGVSVKMVEKQITKALFVFRKEFAELLSIFL
ncbi:RNA polymerase sigma-70 factor [Carboxylicivirga sp. A043]|uniref:RNA polymerase sigma-70 factor n=1 Tax=Carboxylicivirga litoralis TaxID=2816963 RepID=UPI0021CB432E|nr:RNA polymerase sigma-70 factor [Carboxylicivirga sp. A043]MCU4154588.1 RNA polymerase sigma-70 factor [Carboxylicivirga sp. A043]